MSPSLRTVATPEAGDLLGSALHEFAARGLAPLYLQTAHGHRFRLDLGPYFTSPAALDRDERALLAMARGTVLDVGCGPARHARYLQQRGLRALGLDRSAGALAVARALGLRHTIHSAASPTPASRTDGCWSAAGHPPQPRLGGWRCGSSSAAPPDPGSPGCSSAWPPSLRSPPVPAGRWIARSRRGRAT